jgi:hypothetical protein
MIRVLSCLTLVLLMGCSGRELTQGESAFAALIFGDTLNHEKIRFVDGAPTRAVTFRRPARPRVACRELILPPPTSEIVTAKPAAVTLFNRIYFDKDWYLEDYLPDYPDRLSLIAAMLYAHELTHIWQWQNRKRTGYHPLKAAAEHSAADPYLFDLDTAPEFLSYGYEQQGSIVEEYVCCRALAPQAPRTKRLHAMISKEMPLSPLPQSHAHDVGLPWKDVELKGICG